MNSNTSLSAAQDDTYDGRAMVAAFANADSARTAAHALHEDGFHHVWIGITHTAEGGYTSDGTPSDSKNVVAGEDDSFGAKLGRFFTGESDDRSLAATLTRHGVAASEAQRIDASLAPSSAILTVDGHNHPERAAEIIEGAGGHVVAGESFSDTTAAADTTSRRGSDVLGYGSADTMARGEAIDEQQRIKLREERLTVDKTQSSLGEAEVVKDTVSHQQELDVPVIREELFVERRAVSETDGDTSDIDDAGDTIRIPLMREQVVVTKRPVVTGEVVIGKRQITEMQHVSETTREERVRVSGPDGAVTADGYDGQN